MPTYIVAGSTAHFIVQYDSTMGGTGLSMSLSVLSTIESDYSYLRGLFLGLAITTVPIAIQIQPEVEGATNNLTNFIVIKAGTVLATAEWLIVAELAQIFLYAYRGGTSDTDDSKSEALCRLLATERYPPVPTSPLVLNTVNSWLNGGRPNFIDVNDPNYRTGQGLISIGCALGCFNWMISESTATLGDIVELAKMSGTTPATIYFSLTEKTTAWMDYDDVMCWGFPLGIITSLTTDSPFPISAPMEAFRGINGAITGTNGGDGNPFFLLSTEVVNLQIYNNGLIQSPGSAFNQFGDIVVFSSPSIPAAGDVLLAFAS